MTIWLIILTIIIAALLIVKLVPTFVAYYITKHNPPEYYTFDQLLKHLQDDDFSSAYQQQLLSQLTTLFSKAYNVHESIKSADFLASFLKQHPEAGDTNVLVILSPKDFLVKWLDKPALHQCFFNALQESSNAATYDENTHTYFVLATTKNSWLKKML